jgi:hypothetical protein
MIELYQPYISLASSMDMLPTDILTHSFSNLALTQVEQSAHGIAAQVRELLETSAEDEIPLMMYARQPLPSLHIIRHMNEHLLTWVQSNMATLPHLHLSSKTLHRANPKPRRHLTTIRRSPPPFIHTASSLQRCGICVSTCR